MKNTDSNPKNATSKGAKVLISGAGIAGLTHAFWLAKFGFQVTIIERSDKLRDEGYMMDFSAEGIQIASAMGLLDSLYRSSEKLMELEFVSPKGAAQGGFKISDLQDLMREQKSGYMPLMRGDLERTLAGALPENVAVRFSTTIAKMVERADAVEIEFADGRIEGFDNLVIAEGIHSPTRALVFGPESDFIRPLNSLVAIARTKGGGAALDGTVRTNINVGSFAIATPTRDGDVISVFAFLSDATPPRDPVAAKELVRSHFPKHNKFAQHYLNQIEPETDLFIDQVAQIHNPNWCKDRVALIGDAASCMTLLSGQGSIMAMAQAYVLAREMREGGGDYASAFAAYQNALRPDIEGKMKVAAKVSVLIPTNRLQLVLFKMVARFLRFSFAQRILFGSYLKPTIFNKGYPL